MLFKSRKSYILNFALVLTLLSGLLGVGSVKAVTYTVTNVNDSGLGSLRQAIANAGSGDTITFDATLAGQTITLVSNLIINKDLTIDGSGLSSQITISGGNVAHVEVSLSRIVTISDLTIVNGYTSGDGGAVKSSGELTIINSTLRNNHAIGEGGAIDSLGLTLKNSTIYQNQSDSSGGAISIYGNGFHTIVNSTVTQNQAGDSGGAIYIHGNLDVQISNSTFAGNNSASEGKEIMLIGNGILYLQNIIFVCTSPENNDCYVSFGSGGIQYANDSILGFGTFADFGLDELADNGGSTNTMALLLGSLAIDAGNNASCPATDQRNIARPQGNGCDMGAFEYTEGPIVTVTPSPVSPTPTRTPTNTETLVPSLTPTKTPTHTSTSTGTYTSTPTPTNTQTVSPTPVTSCNQITPGPITISG
ncbi:MAG TPA: choice-of-anchor Q domain-containing protein, partial [Anaerolineales bacterium]|nr:choice-of-anchor Q domain-containing protein [Anaerolineales bacterium]